MSDFLNRLADVPAAFNETFGDQSNPQAFLDFLSRMPGGVINLRDVLPEIGGKKKPLYGRHGDAWEYGPPEADPSKLGLAELFKLFNSMGGGAVASRSSGGVGVPAMGNLEKAKLKAYDTSALLAYKALVEGTPLPPEEQFSKLKAIQERLLPLMEKRPKMEDQKLSDSKLSNAAINMGLNLLAKKGLGNSALAAKAGFDQDRMRELASAMEGWKNDEKMAGLMIGAEGEDVAGRNASKMREFNTAMARGKMLGDIGKDMGTVTHYQNADELSRVNHLNDIAAKLFNARLGAASHAEAAAARRDASNPMKRYNDLLAQAMALETVRSKGTPEAIRALEGILNPKGDKPMDMEKAADTITKLTTAFPGLDATYPPHAEVITAFISGKAVPDDIAKVLRSHPAKR